MSEIILSKICTKCEEVKLLKDFGKSKDCLYGVRFECKECSSKRNIEYRHTKKGLVSNIICHQREASKRRGHTPPDYSLAELRGWMDKQMVFHELFAAWVESSHDEMLIPSCDRLDDYTGYSLVNLRIVTWQQNKAKGEADKRNGVNNKDSRAVIQMTGEGEFIKEFHSMRHAEMETWVDHSNISKCCKGNAKTSGGFRWQYKEEEAVA